MNKFLEKLHQLSAAVHLSRIRKEAIRAELLRRIAAGGLSIRTAEAEASLFRRLWAPALSLAAILIIAVTGTSLAAEYSLPGDLLYPVKVDFNEPLVGALNFAPAMKAAWQVRLAERRMEEADQLALKGRLDEAAKTDLADKVVASANKAEQTISDLTGSGDAATAAQVSGRLRASLQAHAQILAKLESNSPEGQALHDQVAAALSQAAATDQETEKSAASQIGLQNSAQDKIAAASTTIASLDDYLNAQSSVLGADASASAAARLSAAEDTLASAESAFAAGQYGQAFELARRAARMAQETRILAEAQVNAAISAAAPAVLPGESGGAAATSLQVDFLSDNGTSTATSTPEATTTEATSTATSTDKSGHSSPALHADGGADINP